MSFTHPLALVLALALVVGFIALWRAASRRAAGDAVAYTDLDFLVDATRGPVRWDRILAIAWTAAAFAVGIAFAGPRVTAPVPVRDATVVICVDTSGSMASTDVSPTRADAAANAVRSFVDQVPAGTRVGIVSFSSAAVIVIPPTDDRDAVRSAVERIPPPNGATAIGDAIATAVSLLPEKGARAVVVVTDGVNNAGLDPLAVARRAGAAGVRLETVGIGTNDSGQTIPGTSEAASIDEDALRQIASEGGGSYHRAADADALRASLSGLARVTTFAPRRLDLAFPLAAFGGLLALAAAGTGIALGRFP